MNKTYNPKEFEEKIYKDWEEKEYFKGNAKSSKEGYSIVMPPPNVTGNLHIGHALNNTIQDILTRWKRMSGYEVLWLPGTDHASISTESKVVEKLEGEGKSKFEIGREGFLEEAWEWTRKYGGTIRNQLKKLGISCDWSRERFTLDEGLSDAVEEVFVRLYNKDLIYRGDRIINWCPNCLTAISDAEVDHEENNGKFWHIKYPVKDSDEFLIIATTRPETLLGDLAVAVHPEDQRYAHLVGKKLILPLMNKEIPVIVDTYVDKEFGSGAVKITPSHDPNDFEVGDRHNLGQCKVMNDDGSINSLGGKYEGMDRFEARKSIVKDLEEIGLLYKIEDHVNNVGHCSRCGTIVEPIISKQWFVAMKKIAEPALKEYEENNLKFIPDRFGKIYKNWLEEIRDWCISRQLWWGHRLPVYYCEDCKEVIVSREEVKTCTKCNSKNIKRDEDTLDTWFSSALWPFSTMGWPEETEDFKKFYPTNVLVTAYDIIFFWVVRMVFSGIEYTGKLPFKDVFINGLVRDSEGRKMSKSLGNGIDPLELIDQYGADALRFMLISGNTPGNDMRFNIERVESSRNFANKLWNASRFVLMNVDKEVELDRENLREEDKWIISNLNTIAKEIDENLEKYELGIAAGKIYDFTWNKYCDWYIEIVKPRLYGEDEKTKEVAKGVLIYVLRNILKLLHPFMPFITEEIWTYLPGTSSSLMMSEWYEYTEDNIYSQSEENIEIIMESIKGIRNIKAEMNVAPSKKSKLIFVTKNESILALLEKSETYFTNLASASSIEIQKNKTGIDDDAVSVVLSNMEIYLPLEDLIDFEKELERLRKEEDKLLNEIKRVDGKLSNEGFVKKAPEKLIEEEKSKKVQFEEMLEKIKERIEKLSSK